MDDPAFLDAVESKAAFEKFVLPGIQEAMRCDYVNRQDLHVVVLRPGAPYMVGYALPILFEYSIGDRSKWKKFDGRTFDDFARAKARISWFTGLSSREAVLTKPYLLLPGDTVLWGSAVIDGVIAGVSGVQPYFDEMFARMTCAAMIGEASHHAAEFFKAPDVPDFLLD